MDRLNFCVKNAQIQLRNVDENNFISKIIIFSLVKSRGPRFQRLFLRVSQKCVENSLCPTH